MSSVLIGVAVGFAVCWALLVLCIRHSYRQRMLDERLNAPLLAECVLRSWVCLSLNATG